MKNEQHENSSVSKDSNEQKMRVNASPFYPKGTNSRLLESSEKSNSFTDKEINDIYFNQVPAQIKKDSLKRL